MRHRANSHCFDHFETISDLRRFLGLVNYYRRCIPHAAQAQATLNEFLKDSRRNDKRKIPWDTASESAFEECKRQVASAIRIAYLSPSAPLALVTDASDTAIGAALEQSVDGIWQPLGFFSRKLSPTEAKYSAYDRELLAMFAATKFFQHMLDGRHFIIKTDHRPLVHAFTQRASKASPRQLNQLSYISQFTTQIVYINGVDNTVADALSRVEAIDMPRVLSPEAIAAAQQSDDELQHLLTNPTSCQLQRLIVEEHPLYCDTSTGRIRPYIPKPLRKRAFDVVHGLSHPSTRTSVRLMREKFVWPGFKRDVALWCRQCIPCQQCKVHRHNRLGPDHITVPDNRFDHVHIDLIELPVCQGLRYCLTMIDRFTRWPVAVPLANIEANTVAKAFYAHWVVQFGTPLTITTDQGSQFESRLFASLAGLTGANKIHTTPYHPKSNGLIERWHRSLKAALMCNAPTPWPDLLPSAVLGLRVAVKEDIGASPAQLLYGTELRIPGEFFINADLPADPNFFLDNFREQIRRIRPTPTAHHTKARLFILKGLYSCSHVFVRIDAVKKPLDPPYAGPYEVVNRPSDRVFVIRINGADKAISVDRLKPAFVVKSDESTPDAPGATTTATRASPTTSNRATSPRLDTRASPPTHDPAAVTEQTLTPASSVPSPPQTIQPSVQSPPATYNIPPEHRSTTMDPPLRTYNRASKRVSFPDAPHQVTGGRVVVAVPSPEVPAPSTSQRDSLPSRPKRQRKQTLIPRTE